MSFERLMREHDELEGLNRALLAAVDGEPDPVRASALLRKFADRITRHRKFEQDNIYRPLIEISRRRDLHEPISLELLAMQMDRDWPAYLERWSEQRIGAAWMIFKAETRRILTVGLARLRLENAVIYPLALKHGTIRLRETA